MFRDSVSAVARIHELGLLPGKRWGMLTNEAAKTDSGEPSRVCLLKNGLHLVRLFSPEHGLSVDQPDGEVVGDGTDALTGLPVISLYGERLKPTPGQMSGLDAVLFDIPDVGCRFYTYLWSMTYMMEACHEAGIPLVILDRPNPIGGDFSKCEGPMLDEEHCSSFIGRWSIPVRHSCTCGELARFFQSVRMPALNLFVLPYMSWQRNKSFWEDGFFFEPTSPAIRDAQTALLYPGTGLLEGIRINEGRGTPFPFRQAGAPWIDPEVLWNFLEKQGWAGVTAEKVAFSPEWGLFAGEKCAGLLFSVTDAQTFSPVRFGVQLIRGLMTCFPQWVEPRLYPTAANPGGGGHLDRLTGIPDAFERLSHGEDICTGTGDWANRLRPFLLY